MHWSVNTVRGCNAGELNQSFSQNLVLKKLLVNCVVALTCVILCGAEANAQTAAPSLTGETFVSNVFTIDQILCDKGTATYYFSATGMAVGPYPGMFFEQGKFTVFSDGSALFVANFTIFSDIQVEGIKTGRISGAPPNPCVVVEAPVIAEGIVDYSANIPDEGISFVSIVYDRRARRGVLNQQFFSTRPQEPAVVVLEPKFAENPVGTNHTVTATVTTSGGPVVGVTVNFTVEGAWVNTTGSCTTDGNGQCMFTYQGPPEPDVNTITGCVDYNGSTTCDIATKVFFLPASTPGQVTGGGHILVNDIIHAVSFGFNAQFSDSRGFKGQGVVVDHRDGTRIKILDVEYLLITGTHAQFRGNAEINGVATKYVIDVDDLAEPGVLVDTFTIRTDSGYSAGGFVSGGNIQIHKAQMMALGFKSPRDYQFAQ